VAGVGCRLAGQARNIRLFFYCCGPQPTPAPSPFEFTFTPKHGSWFNLVEGFFSKLARSVLRHIRVASKQELKDRLLAALDYFNSDPVVHTWTYKLDKSARYDSNFKIAGLVIRL
jgi:transposase